MDIASDVVINAPATVVWSVLSDPVRWPEWTESMDSVELLDGRLGPGARVRIVQPGLRPSVWTVTRYVAESAFSWTSRVGGVTTTGSHELLAGPDGTSRLRLGIRQHGVLAPLVALLLGGRVRRYLELETAGLKAEAESRVRSADGRL